MQNVCMTKTHAHSAHDVFQARIKRVDPHFARHGVSKRQYTNINKRPVLSVLMGFGWVYFVVSIAKNRDMVKSSLAQGTLGADVQLWIMGGLGLFMILSLFMIAFHTSRFFLKGRDQRGASGSILLGGLAAIMLLSTPPSAYQTITDGVLSGSSGVLMAALDTAGQNGVDLDLDVDVSGLALVSSLGQ